MNPIAAMSNEELYKLAGILDKETRKAQALLFRVTKEIKRRKKAIKPARSEHECNSR